MSAQLSLIYSPATEGRKDFLACVEALRSALAYLGLKDVAFELDVGSTYVGDALSERDRKRWACEWTFVIKRMLQKRGDVLALQLLRNIVLCELVGTELELAGENEISDDEMKAALAAIASVRRAKKAKR